ncbi:hypothetical protein L207DRAFT_638357 [Hyaloscypha variabilis F]|uniref:dolichol kinase n=1 Tax=Hyaloscypha variabilis (strain UAMH 11265 / GT02V1 / F) TaxID=1149755 RepID=A0A2J6R8N2_HYAVF|nr:hypothetical protein L207DRAFT_638357 [Hyaloscypha variabilis F]
MPEKLKAPSLQQSHAQNLRDGALRRLSRSPHPYFRQKFELAHPSEGFPLVAPPTQSQPPPTRPEDEDEQNGSRPHSRSYRESTNSDSGTEADDEHFLKGLPAPKLRPHKGLRGVEGSLSSSPSPLLSPAILDEDPAKVRNYLRKASITILDDERVRKVAEKLRQKRRVEVLRRATEGAILVLVGSMLCCDLDVRKLLRLWRRELVCQALIISSLVAIYPLRLLRHLNPSQPWKKPFPLVLPASFDPAPLLYPPSLTMLVSMILSKLTPIGLLPSIILGISSLPRHLIPSVGGLGGANTTHWFLSCIPLLVPKTLATSKVMDDALEHNPALAPESLVLLQPLHQALCFTLNHLTTTSLLPAELQLLSVSLIELLLLASSPQAIILKALLWVGGVGVLISCAHVLRWGISLARVPKWRFRRAGDVSKEKGISFMIKPLVLVLGKTSGLAKDPVMSDGSSDEEDVAGSSAASPKLQLNTSMSAPQTAEPGSMSAVEPKTKSSNGSAKMGRDQNFSAGRRHTLPTLSFLPARSSKRTPSGRRKRASSSSVQAFFSLTQRQATIRKWLYAGYVYICVLAIILIAIREYVGIVALNGNEPVGWALGYLFGDLPRFRMEVVSSNLQRWICLPPRSGLEHEESCYLGWVEHLRHASFGEANTRLILSAYWLAIIIVGLAIVFQLSAVYEVDTRRKVFHFMMVAMLLPATYVDPTFAALALSLMLAIFLLLDLFRASQLPPLSKSLAYFLTPYVDGRDLKGPVVISHIFLLIGCAIPLWLSLGSLPRSGNGYLEGWEVPTREVSMVSGVICVGMGDAAASLIGRRYGRHKWIWGGGKSIEGSLAFATAVGLALLLAKAWLRIGGWPANNEDSWVRTGVKAGAVAGIASLTEAVLTGGNDNVVVPVILWLCVKGLDI